MKKVYTLKAEVRLYPGNTPWHFLSLPKRESEEIKRTFGKVKRGFGSVPVIVTIGTSSWKTSIFPYAKEGVYILPLKAEVRRRENIRVGQNISFIVVLK